MLQCASVLLLRWLREDAISWSVFFFLFSFAFLKNVFIVKVQELACSASYGGKKTLISTNQKTNESYKIISKLCRVLDRWLPSHGSQIIG